MPRDKRRLQAELDLPTVQLRPAARPQDTFVQPATTAGSQAAQLAQALSHLAPSLARFGDQMFERKAKQDVLRGAEQARETVRQLDESRKTYAEAVKEGRIPAHLNPWMKQGYYEELGRVYAGRLDADLTVAVQTDETLKNTVEMSDFRGFVSKFEQGWMEANVPGEIRNDAFGVGYGNRRDAYLQNLEKGWAAQTEQRFTKRSLAMFRDDAVQFTQDALDKEFTPAEIGDFLRIMWDDKHALGWDGRLTGTTLVDAIADVALARKDPELMEQLLASIPGGDGKSPKATLSKTAYAIQKSEDVAEAIFTTRRREWARQDRETADAVKKIESTAAQRFEAAQKEGLDQDDVPIDDLQQQAISLGEVALSGRLQTLKEAYQNQEYDDDNELVAGFLQKLHKGPFALKQAELDTALRNKRLSLTTYNSISSTLRSYQEAEKDRSNKKAFLEDDPYHEYGEKAVRSYFGSSPDADVPEVAYRRMQAARQFSSWYYQEFVADDAPKKAVSGRERREAIDAMAQDLARTWVPYEDSFSGTFRLSGQDLDWRARPVDIPDRAQPMLDELAGFLSGRASGRPSPALISLLTVYGVNLDNKDEMLEFLKKQRSFITPVTPRNAPGKPK